MSEELIFTGNETKDNIRVQVGAHVAKVSGNLGGGNLVLTDSDGVPIYTFEANEARGVFFTTSYIQAQLSSSSGADCELHIVRHF